MALIHYTSCPCCHSNNIQEVLTAKDYTVSHKTFTIWQCNDCTLRFTQDVPDAETIGPYYQSTDYISHSDTNKGLINRLYHMVRKRTLASKAALVQHTSGKQKGHLLDVGAGTGAFLHHLQSTGWQVQGLEPDNIARANAKKLHGLDLAEPSTLFQLQPNSYDVITMWHVLEHVHTLHEYIEQFRKLLKKDGVLLIAVPNYTSLDASLYGPHWAAYDVPRHLYHFSPKSIHSLVTQHGLQVKAMRPMWFDSFYISMLSEQYKNGKGNIVKAFVNGLRSNSKAWSNTEKCSSVIYVITPSSTQTI